jgi:glutamate 5-kinase
MKKTIIVKIGSESLKDFETSKKVEKLVTDIAQKMQEWVQVILVTSGAVQFGREHSIGIENKQILAAIGWPHLIHAYGKRFRSENISIASFLVTHADIEDRQDRAQTFVDTIEQAWTVWILPIVNENDPISTEEMREVGRWADNDKNALLLSRLFHADQIVLITNTDGVYRDATDPSTRIQKIESDTLTEEYIDTLCQGKSMTWTGGMASKLSVAQIAWELGITTHICNGMDSWLTNQLNGGTTIFPSKK